MSKYFIILTHKNSTTFLQDIVHSEKTTETTPKFGPQLKSAWDFTTRKVAEAVRKTIILPEDRKTGRLAIVDFSDADEAGDDA
jgi:hypothetical protein